MPASRSPTVLSRISLTGIMIAAPITGPQSVPTPPTRHTTSVCTITRTPKTASGGEPRLLVLLDPAQRVAEARAFDQAREHQRRGEQAQREEIEGARLGELHEQGRGIAHHRDRPFLLPRLC